MKILTIKINLANTIDHDQFASLIQFDVKKLKTYSRVMEDPYATEWAKTIEEELN